jgi:hypothetical protein
MLQWDGCLYGCLYNGLYSDETTNAENLSFNTSIPRNDRNRHRLAKRRRKIPPSWPPDAILNFRRPRSENAIAFEPFEISTPGRRHFVQGGIAFNSRSIMIVINVKIAASRHLDFATISL